MLRMETIANPYRPIPVFSKAICFSQALNASRRTYSIPAEEQVVHRHASRFPSISVLLLVALPGPIYGFPTIDQSSPPSGIDPSLHTAMLEE